jgi:hypothetical protein
MPHTFLLEIVMMLEGQSSRSESCDHGFFAGLWSVLEDDTAKWATGLEANSPSRGSRFAGLTAGFIPIEQIQRQLFSIPILPLFVIRVAPASKLDARLFPQ